MKRTLQTIGTIVTVLTTLKKLGPLAGLAARLNPFAAVLVPLIGAGGSIIVNVVKTLLEAVAVVAAHPATLLLLALTFGYGVVHGTEKGKATPVPCIEQPVKGKVATPLRRSHHK